jgi:hypothetical protein
MFVRCITRIILPAYRLVNQCTWYVEGSRIEPTWSNRPSDFVFGYCRILLNYCSLKLSIFLIMKANEMHYFSHLFDKVLYMFRTSPLSIISSIATLYTLTGTCHASSVGCLLARSGPDYSSRQPTELTWQIPTACIQCWDTPDDGQWTCPKHASSVGCLLSWSGPKHASGQPTELTWQIPTACIQCWDTADDGQWTCPKHVEYFIK